MSKLPTTFHKRNSPKQLRSAVRFNWRLNDTLLPTSLYSRGQLLVHSSTSNSVSSSISDSFSNYGTNTADSRTDDQNNKYRSHQYLVNNQEKEAWSKLKHKRSDLSFNDPVNKNLNLLTQKDVHIEDVDSLKSNNESRIKRDSVNTNNLNNSSIVNNQKRKQDFKFDNLNTKNKSTIYNEHSALMNNEEQLNLSINEQQPIKLKQFRQKKDKKNSISSDYPNYYLESNQLNNFDTNNNHQSIDSSSFHSTNHHSNNVSDIYISKLNLDTKLYAFGTVECYAENEIGLQEEPCVYQIIPAGKLTFKQVV